MLNGLSLICILPPLCFVITLSPRSEAMFSYNANVWCPVFEISFSNDLLLDSRFHCYTDPSAGKYWWEEILAFSHPENF